MDWTTDYQRGFQFDKEKVIGALGFLLSSCVHYSSLCFRVLVFSFFFPFIFSSNPSEHRRIDIK